MSIKSLQEIKELTEKYNPCKDNWVPFVEALDKGDEESAWELVRGNIGFLVSPRGLLREGILTLDEARELSGRAISYYSSSGELIIYEFYLKNGVVDGWLTATHQKTNTIRHHKFYRNGKMEYFAYGPIQR